MTPRVPLYCRTDSDIWQQRRHIAKAAQIGQNFVQVFGADSFLTKIRPIWADVWSFPNHNMSATLEWFNKTYGPPSKFFYGMSVAGCESRVFCMGRQPR